MRLTSIVLATALIATPAMAQDPVTPIPRDGPLDAFATVILVIPAVLYVIGEAWDAACTSAGFVYAVDPEDNMWKCNAPTADQ